MKETTLIFVGVWGWPLRRPGRQGADLHRDKSSLRDVEEILEVGTRPSGRRLLAST